MNLRADRSALGISQSKLARLSGVSRFKICTFELGSGALNPNELNRIKRVFCAEAERLRTISRQIDLRVSASGGSSAPTRRKVDEV